MLKKCFDSYQLKISWENVGEIDASSLLSPPPPTQNENDGIRFLSVGISTLGTTQVLMFLKNLELILLDVVLIG